MSLNNISSRDVEQPNNVSQQHQQSISKEVLAHDLNSTEAFIALEANLHADVAEAQARDEGNIHSAPAVTTPPETMVNNQQHSITFQYISDEVVRNDIGTDYETFLSPVTVKSLDVNSVVISSNVTVDPTLQREVNYMNDWLAKAAESDVPFVPVLSKKKKGNKTLKGSTSTAYQTRSLGPLPKPQ
jgi:hypothetical protein